jgi:hypothetical protein
MNQQQAKASLSFEDTGSKSAPVPLFQEETTANQEEVMFEVSPSAISQAQAGAAFAANPDELTKAMQELQTLLGGLEGEQSSSNETASVKKTEALWPEDLNTKQFRGMVEKADGPTWGFDPGFQATQS